MAIRSLSGFTAVNGVLSKGGGAGKGLEPMIPFDAATGHGNGGGTSTRVTGEAVMTVMAVMAVMTVMMRRWGSHPRARRFLRTRCVASARRTRSGV